MTRRQILRQLVNKRRGLVVPGAYDGVSAKLVEHAGFPVVYMSWRLGVSRRLGVILGLALLAAGCTSMGDPGWSAGTSSGCRQQYGSRGSTSATRPDVVFFCSESP